MTVNYNFVRQNKIDDVSSFCYDLLENKKFSNAWENGPMIQWINLLTLRLSMREICSFRVAKNVLTVRKSDLEAVMQMKRI